MKHRLALAVSLACAALSAPALAQKAEMLPEWRDTTIESNNEIRPKLEGKPAPKLDALSQWTNTKGRSWADYRGKVVVLDMWATWCAPCVEGIPHLVEMHNKYKDDGLVILGVHSSVKVETMAGYVRDKKLPYAFAADADRKLATKLGVKYIPSYFIIDKFGTMRVAYAKRDKLDEIVKALLAEPGRAPETKSRAVTSTAGYPSHNQKKLYADNDLRGKAAPELLVETWISQKPDTEGKVMLVDFWATWCPPCRKAIPELNHWQEQFADDLVIVGLSDEDPATVRTFLETTEVNYTMAIDTQKRTYGALAVRAIPHVMIVSTDGIVRWQGFPGLKEDPLTADIIKQIIDADPGVAKRHAAAGD